VFLDQPAEALPMCPRLPPHSAKDARWGPRLATAEVA
jgi:hypothetical protein